MKFLCPQCKAKYRIADEKLAERQSSRMKCRKCGHVIDIHSATVPDDSMPPPGVAPNERISVTPPPPPAAGAALRKPGPALPRAAAGQAGPQPRRPAVGAAPVVRRPTTSTAAAVKRPVPPPRRGGAAVAQAVAEKPAAVDEALETAPAATKPALTKPSAEPVPTPPPDDVAPVDRVSRPMAEPALDRVSRPMAEPALDRVSRPMAEPLGRNEFEEEPTRIHDGSHLAAAFSSVSGQTVGGASAPATGDEWYIGIDGTPLGPVGLSVIREKAAERKATFESLVWREGFEEWKPLKQFPELVALVEEARRDLPADAHELHTIPAPSPLDVQPVKPKAAGSEVPSDLLEQIGVSRPKGVSHPAAWTAVIVAVAFGVTIGSVLLSKTEKQEVVKYVEVPASATAVAATSADPMVIEESTVSGGNTKKAVTSAQKPEPTAAPAKTGMPSLSGLNGLNGLGPATQGPDVASNNQNLPGGQLDGNAIQKVVANFSNSVRRGCWDSALSARTPDAPSTARVSVQISISPSGSVDNVTTSGDPKGYPNLAHCIESKVRGWRFPRSSGSTTAQVPFVFAAQ